MFLKRIISTVLSAVLLLSLLAGCTPPVSPTDPTEPTVPTIPTTPTTPTQPTEQTEPTEPAQPTVPTQPTEPTEPAELVTVFCIQEALDWKKKNDQTRHSIFTYDTSGNLLNRKSETDGQYNTEEIYQYDDYGNLIYGPLRVGSTFEPITYTYDERGRLLSESYKDFNQIQMIYSYDDVGNLIGEEHWSNGELSRKITMEYNDAGQRVYEEWDYVLEHVPDIFIYWVYDDRGNPLTQTTYYDDQYRGEMTYTYDENGRMKTRKWVWDGYTQYAYTYYYDQEGRRFYRNPMTKARSLKIRRFTIRRRHTNTMSGGT